MLAYATVDVPLQEALAAPGAPLTFGATSFQGVFTPKGFRRGFHGLAATEEDGVRAAARLVRTDGAGARAATREAVKSLLAELGGRARAILVHATPGFEERVLEGLAEVDAAAGVPVFGGSAADDDLSGKWSVFLGREVVSEGVLLVAFASDRDVKGAFVSGYFGTKRSGRVTRAEGRTVYAIDDRPAAEVLDEWMGGALAAARAEGGIVLAETTLSPVGRVVDRTHGVTRYLLSHPHLVNASDGAVSFFTDMSNGDEVELMMATRGSLMDRVDHVVRRARRGAKTALAGGVLIYHQDLGAATRPDPTSGLPYFLSLLEQDDNDGLVRNSFEGGNRGEAGDAWGLGEVPNQLSSITSPSTRLNNGRATEVVFHSIFVQGGQARIALSTQLVVTEQQIVQFFLEPNSEPLSELELAYVDSEGNRNGRLDVGDLRRWLREHGN